MGVIYKAKKRFQRLEQYDLDTGIATGVYKDNIEGDPNYIPPVEDLQLCPVRVSTGQENIADMPQLEPNIDIQYAEPSIEP